MDADNFMMILWCIFCWKQSAKDFRWILFLYCWLFKQSTIRKHLKTTYYFIAGHEQTAVYAHTHASRLSGHKKIKEPNLKQKQREAEAHLEFTPQVTHQWHHECTYEYYESIHPYNLHQPWPPLRMELSSEPAVHSALQLLWCWKYSSQSNHLNQTD